MGLTEFVDTFYRKIGNSYFPLYNLIVIGFAVTDSSYLEPETYPCPQCQGGGCPYCCGYGTIPK